MSREVALRVDMHRHLGGSIPPEFIWSAIRQQDLHFLAESYDDVLRQVTFSTDEPRSFHRFLDKFRILDNIRWSEALIDQSIAAVCAQLRAERLDYCWMRCSINKYMGHINWHRHEAIKFIYDSFQRHAPGQVGLILSLKYESARASQRQLGRLITEHNLADYLIGIDLVGDEAYFDAGFYAPIFQEWKRAGKLTCAHLAESQPASNVRQAIEQLALDRVAHGLRIWQSPEIMQLARERGVGFDLALTSNYLTGVWTSPHWHPIRALFDYGLECTIGTDDPVQTGTTLDDEFDLLRGLGFNQQECAQIAANAAMASLRHNLVRAA